MNTSNVYCDKCGKLISGTPTGTGQQYCDCKSQTPVGWICPRCHKVHSPYSMTCDCLPQTGTHGGSTTLYKASVVLTDMGWLLTNSEDIDPEFNDIVNQGFWNLI